MVLTIALVATADRSSAGRRSARRAPSRACSSPRTKSPRAVGRLYLSFVPKGSNRERIPNQHDTAVCAPLFLPIPIRSVWSGQRPRGGPQGRSCSRPTDTVVCSVARSVGPSNVTNHQLQTHCAFSHIDVPSHPHGLSHGVRRTEVESRQCLRASPLSLRLCQSIGLTGSSESVTHAAGLPTKNTGQDA